MPNKKLSVYNVELTRLDEQQIISYQIAVDSDSNEDQALAIRKAEEQFAIDAPNSTIVSNDVISDPRQRANLPKGSTFWRNRFNKSNDIYI